MKRPYDLPNMTQLASFEAAARRRSFKEAAQELNVTASAISHQIRALEEDLNCQLFDRRGRVIALTEVGEILYEHTRTNFETLSDSIKNIRTQAEKNTITITATTAVSSLWLAPRVSRFLNERPKYRVNQRLSDEPSIGAFKAELSVEYGRNERSGFEAIHLLRDELVPVASPSFASRYNSLNLPSLARLPLIQLESSEEIWTSWKDWFRKLGYLGDINYSQRVNNYLVALQIAKEGGGVVLGWRNLIAPMIAKKELAVVSNFSIPAEHSFYLMCMDNDRLPLAAREFRDWLVNPAQQEMNFFPID